MVARMETILFLLCIINSAKQKQRQVFLTNCCPSGMVWESCRLFGLSDFPQLLSYDFGYVFAKDVKLDVDHCTGLDLVKVGHFPGEGDNCHIK